MNKQGISISLDSEVLTEIKKAAKERNISISFFMEIAAKDFLKTEQSELTNLEKLLKETVAKELDKVIPALLRQCRGY